MSQVEDLVIFCYWQVAKVTDGNFSELIWHLIYARGITNELDKLRFDIAFVFVI